MARRSRSAVGDPGGGRHPARRGAGADRGATGAPGAGGETVGAYLGTLRRTGLADVAGDIVRASAACFIDGETPRV